MKKLIANWFSKISSLLAKKVGGSNAATVLKDPEKIIQKRHRLQWAGACASLAVALSAGMYFGLGWACPTEDDMHFREEVSTLLRIQGYLMKKNDKLIPTMDSIRDVMFGPKTYGRGIRDISRNMLRDRASSNLDPELAVILEESLRQWDESEKELGKDKLSFVAGFATLSAGLPAMLLLVGFPGYQKVRGKIAARRAAKRAAGQKRRQMMADRAKVNRSRTVK